MKKIVLSLGLLGLLFSQTLFADDSVWRDIQSSTLPPATAILNKQLSKDLNQDQQPALPKQLKVFRTLSLDESQLKHNLQQLSLSQKSEVLGKSLNSNALTMEIPLPTGELVSVSLEQTQLLSPKLVAQYPFIKTWKVRGVDNKSIYGVIDITSYGFHAMLLMPDGDTVFVERENRNTAGVYNSFSKQANTGSFKQDFQCELHGEHNSSDESTSPIRPLQRIASREAAVPLITYRLIVAATGEYTQFHGSVSNAFSAISTTINRVNVINERDLSITFDLVDGLVYTDPARDPYNNSDSSDMLIQNIAIMADEFNASDFDIGHVFSQGAPSGLALLGSACHDDTYRFTGGILPGAKAGGVTGSPSPKGDAFDVDFVAHELGHQLGGKHTFNSETGSCGGGNRTGGSAVEPGSGSTIMAYAGICGSNDLQEHSDFYYHTKSILEISTYTRDDNIGKSCGLRSSSSNSSPEPATRQDTVIPARTPFILKSSAFDPDDDSLAYTWDQMDAGQVSNIGENREDKGDNALIRSIPPTSSSTRYVPRLTHLFSNLNEGETLPSTNRDLNFAFIVRDGKGGIGIGAEILNNNEIAYLKLQVADKGQVFQLESHGFERNLGVNQTTKVSWNIAGTNSSPINCSSVDISLIQSNGKRVSVKSNTSNDGSETVTIPSSALGMSSARMMVACRRPASTFFNVAKGGLTIVASGQGEADSSDNNGAGSDNSGGGGTVGSSGGGSVNISHFLFLLSLVLLVQWKRREKQSRQLQKLKRVRSARGA